MKIVSVVGLGVIGMSVLECLHKYYNLIGVDIKEDILNRCSKDYSDILFTTKTLPSDIFIVVVQTPLKEDNNPDLSFFWKALKNITKVARPGNLVIINSTIPPNTMSKVEKLFISHGFTIGSNLYLTYCPERILPGNNMIKEFRENTRIISGDYTSCRKAEDLYNKITSSKKIFTSFINAELIKLAENSYRDINIAFANELAKISEHYNANIKDIINIANLHPRVNIHNPGVGVGGHCIAVDPFFLISDCDTNRVLKTARAVNNSMPDYCCNKLSKLFPSFNKIAFFGLSYKPNVNDLRESPAVELVDKLEYNGHTIKVYDPYINNKNDIYTACSGSDCIFIGCDHDYFKTLSLKELKLIKQRLNNNILITPFLTQYDNFIKAGFTIHNIFDGKNN
jgi:UDP-N-acetyl-D-mannosaminuronic acid dehydrogenase